MERIYVNHSLRNIPLPRNSDFSECLLAKTEEFLKRMRWKLYFHKNPSENTNCKNTFGFKSGVTPPPDDDLDSFESDMMHMAANVKFKKMDMCTNPMLKSMKKQIDDIRRSDKLVVKSDKTSNLYNVEKVTYDKLLSGSITATYKKDSSNTIAEVNREASAIATNLGLQERINCFMEKSPMITLKDHKDGFRERPQVRLLNPANTNIGKISKHILDRINLDIRSKTNLPLWRSSKEVLNWFRNLEDKKRLKFMKYDICNYYASISEALLMKALTWAKQFAEISDLDIAIILNSRRSFLFYNGSTWIKSGSNFDCPMGSLDSAEVSDLIGLYMLHKLSEHVDIRKCGGQYRDDGLLALKGSGPELERIKKLIVKIFKEEGLTLENNIICSSATDFLDISMDLINETHKPYLNPNKVLKYVAKTSNHPPAIIANLPSMIQKRIIDLSSSLEIFEKCKGPYEDALRASGFEGNLTYSPQSTKRKRSRKREVNYYTPPFSLNVKTRIGGCLFFLLKKHFPKGSNLHRLFNRNTIKISYSCLPNYDCILKGINKNKIGKVSSKTPKTTECNSLGVCKRSCIAKNVCEKSSVVYKATVHVNDGSIYKRVYIGMTEGKLKDRVSKHYTDFDYERYRNNTTLSKFIWELQKSNSTFQIEWDILESKPAYKKGHIFCKLFICESLGRQGTFKFK